MIWKIQFPLPQFLPYSFISVSKVAKKRERRSITNYDNLSFGTYTWNKTFHYDKVLFDNFESFLWSLWFRFFFLLRIQQLRKLFTEFVFWRGLYTQTNFPYKTDKWSQPNQLKLTQIYKPSKNLWNHLHDKWELMNRRN